MTEVGGQKSDDRGQRAEGREHSTKGFVIESK